MHINKISHSVIELFYIVSQFYEIIIIIPSTRQIRESNEVERGIEKCWSSCKNQSYLNHTRRREPTNLHIAKEGDKMLNRTSKECSSITERTRDN